MSDFLFRLGFLPGRERTENIWGCKAETLFRSRAISFRFVVGRVALGQVFLRVCRFSRAGIIPPVLYTHLHDAIFRRTSGRSLGICKYSSLFCKSGVWKGSYFHLSANIAGACIPECEDVDPLMTEAFRAAVVTSSLYVFWSLRKCVSSHL